MVTVTATPTLGLAETPDVATLGSQSGASVLEADVLVSSSVPLTPLTAAATISGSLLGEETYFPGFSSMSIFSLLH